MLITDLTDEHLHAYFNCLEEWSEEMKDAGNHKEMWYNANREKGLRVKLAKTDDGKVVGMIQYIPAEHAPVRAKDVYYIYCIWVHGHKEGVGNYQKKGIGTTLLNAAEEDARSMGAKGIVAWGLRLPFFMRASWFRKHGYRPVDNYGMIQLLLKEFGPGVERPRLLRVNKKIVRRTGRVVVTCLKNGWCPAQNIAFERAKGIAGEFPGCVEFVEIDTSDRAVLEEYGMSDALFIDNKSVRTGPPPSREKIRKLVTRQLKRRQLWKDAIQDP